MVLTPSTMVTLGTEAPPFTLLDAVSQNKRSLAELKGAKGTLVMFICNHCPFVKHIQSELAHFGNDYKNKDISIIAINANDAEEYPEDSPANMRAIAQRFGYPFPYLYDETQQVAKSYQAACTPDFFLFDKQLHLVYRGQFDDSRPSNSIPVTGQDLRNAMDCLLAQKPIPTNQKPSIGCNIKWKE